MSAPTRLPNTAILGPEKLNPENLSQAPLAPANGATPFHDPLWIAGAWAGDDAPRVTVGDGALGLTAAVRSIDSHDFHHPAPLVGGEREGAFLAAAQRQRWRRAPWPPVMTTVSPFGYRGAPPQGDLDLPRARRLAAALVDAARRHRCGAVLSHYLFDDEDGPWMTALKELGAEILTLGAHTHLDLWFQDLDEYHRWLGPSRRTVRARRSVSCPGATVHWTDGPVAPALAANLGDLLDRKLGRFGSHAPPAAFLRSLVEGTLQQRRLFVAVEGTGRGGDDLLRHSAAAEAHRARSVLVSLPWRGTLYAKFFASARGGGDYLPLVFHHQIKAALESGLRRIDFGGASHWTKLFRGASLRLGRGALLALSPAVRERLPLARQSSQLKEGYFLALRQRWERPVPGSILHHPAALRPNSKPMSQDALEEP